MIKAFVKILLIQVFLMGAFCVYAQPPAALKVAPKFSTLTKAKINFATMERYVLHQVKVPQVETCPQYWPCVSSFSTKYRNTLTQFDNFKKELDVTLYYQAKASERREFMPEERRQLLEKINNMEPMIFALQSKLTKPDPQLTFAQEYLEYAKSVISPFSVSKTPNPLQRTDREFNMDEFFLHSPEEGFFSFFKLSALRPQGLAKSLPDGLIVAIVNDRNTVLQRMKALHEKGVFLPTSKLYFYEDAEALLSSVLDGRVIPDVILTDLVMPQRGGYYISNNLRKNNYEGTILALSAFQEDETLGKELFSHGIDGMIPQPIGFEDGFDWPYTITKSLVNYFHYKRLNSWSH